MISAVLMAGGWVLAGARLVLDLIGYSTAPEDVGVARTRLEQALDLLLATPWWAILGVALIMTLWLMWLSWPQPVPITQKETNGHRTPEKQNDSPQITDDYSEDPAGEASDPQAYNDLVTFAAEYLIPACENLLAVQREIIDQNAASPAIAAYASKGLTDEWKAFFRLYEGLVESPGPIIRFEPLINCIYELESGEYRKALESTKQMLKEIDTTRNPIMSSWRIWEYSHRVMVEAYEKIKRDSRFGSLFRPVRESRWGGLDSLL
jgi:hypothetical protein